MKGSKSVELKPNGENSLATLIGLAIPPTLPGELTFLFPAPIDLFDLRSTKDGLFKPSFSSNRHVHLAHKTNVHFEPSYTNDDKGKEHTQ